MGVREAGPRVVDSPVVLVDVSGQVTMGDKLAA
jgi:hypothetical protein